MRLERVWPSYRINLWIKAMLKRSVCEKGEELWRRRERERGAGWERLRGDDRYAWGQGIGIEWREKGPRDSVGTSLGGDEGGQEHRCSKGFCQDHGGGCWHFITWRGEPLTSPPCRLMLVRPLAAFHTRRGEASLSSYCLGNAAQTLYKTNTRKKQSKSNM